MRRVTLLSILLSSLALMAWLPACQSPQSTDQIDASYYTREQVPNLDDPYGGFNLGDEDPAFDDSMLLSEFSGSEDVEYDDSMANDETVNDLERTGARHFFLRIAWGNLKRDSTINFATDWSGSLTVDNGAIVLKRLIRFEVFDRILPRTRRGLLEWVSHTGPSFDGILVKIFPALSSTAATLLDDSTKVVTFATGPLEVSFSLAELRNIHRVIPVDDAGNAVAFNAIHILPHMCPQGFLGGIWRDDPDTVGGVFFGKWVSQTGRLMGHLRGFYGVNSNGENVFFGKYIDTAGRFRGILRGRYGRISVDGPGVFAGIFLDRELHIRGDLKGIWMTNDRIESGGFFRGVWRMRCR